MNGWISVKDRLPETKPDEDWFSSKNVLALLKGNYSDGLVTTAFYQHGEDEDGYKWAQWIDCLIYESIDNVTHWMPLPEPPKEAV